MGEIGSTDSSQSDLVSLLPTDSKVKFFAQFDCAPLSLGIM